MIWFTSDLHLGHLNIIRYCNRPHGSVKLMNEQLIANWNSLITPDDTVYLLGDVSFTRPDITVDFLRRMNGNKRLLIGNHDDRNCKNEAFRLQFDEICDIFDIKHDGHHIVLCHYPIESWNRKTHGSWHLHGHTHHERGRYDGENRLDVGVDNFGYHPVSIDDVCGIMKDGAHTDVLQS